MLFFFSCNTSPVSNKKEEVSTTAKKDTSNQDTHSKKDTAAKNNSGALVEKNTAKKWNANAAAAQIKFKVDGPFGTVNGSLSGLKSTILFDENNLAASSIHAGVEAKSINTGIGLRNRDLQKEKYLDADNHPVMSFKSSKIEKSGKGYKAIGDLTIKGITKHAEIPFSFSGKGNTGIFKGNFTIQREDYGIGKAGGSIGSTVSIDLEVPVTN